jgi:glucuronate isomerase
MATRLRRRGIPLLVQSHNSWVDLGRPSFWITLQISQFMVRSSFPFFDPPLFDNPMAADLFPTIPAIMRRVHVWASCRASRWTFKRCCRQGGGRNPAYASPKCRPSKSGVLATTDSPLDSLADHQAIRESSWKARILPTFRPDPVVDPESAGFADNITKLCEKTGEDTSAWTGYLNALRKTRHRFRELGCTATDHGHPSARTANLATAEAAELFSHVIAGNADAHQQELFRAQMLTEMARMSLEDGLVMQIHPGSARNHNRKLYEQYGRDIGADIPMPTNYVDALRPLLDQFGNERDLTIILFTLDESTYSRELAPLAGHYPCLRLGSPWWFHDSPEGMRRFRERVTETAGFYKTVGFNDDTRAFLSIPGRHDVARRVDCTFLAKQVAEHRLEEDEALEVAQDLAYGLVKKTYRL